MSEWTVTVQDIITLAAIIGAITVVWNWGKKPFDLMQKIYKVTTRTAKQVKLHGDMISELLDHAITNNNTGRMSEIKKKYDETYRNMTDDEMEND